MEAIDHLFPGKAPENGIISVEVLKDLKELVLSHLYQLLFSCGKDDEILHDVRGAKIITLYKNKGDKGGFNNYMYCGILLLSITSKAFARVILSRLQKLADRFLPEMHYGYKK